MPLAGKYVVHFGSRADDAARQLQTAIAAQHPDRPPPPVTSLARLRTDVQVIPASSGNQLVAQRSLQLDERMIALAAAISIDYDYFSRHSYGGGVLSPFVHPPMIPFPMPGMGGGGEGAADAAAGGEAEAGAVPPGAGEAGEFGESGSPGPLEGDLGSDDWPGGGDQGSGSGGGGFWGGSDDAGDGSSGGFGDSDDGEDSIGFGDLLGGVFGWGDED